MKKLFLGLIVVLVSILSVDAQQLSSQARISVLTVSPGDELYTKFGHSAIRVFDPVRHIDLVFNYGTFDFNTPHFYLKFIKGRLNYMLSVQTFSGFKWSYGQENRWVDEQVLNLSQGQKQKVFEFLIWNSQPANRYYLYDFFFDNCATRVRDVFFNQLKDSLVFDNQRLNLTFRQAFNRYMKGNPWVLFGENLVVGSIADRKMDAWHAMYLPDYLEFYFDKIKIKTGDGLKPFVLVKRRIIKADRPMPHFPWYSPWVIFSVLALVLLYVEIVELKRGRRICWIDFVLFFILGLAGLVIVLLWFFTDHLAAKNNFNVLWAFPLHIVYAFYLLKRRLPAWVKVYSKIFLYLTALILVVYIVGFLFNFWLIPQMVDYGVIPLLVITISRLYVITQID